MKVFVSWSGGKESALAAYKAILEGHEISYLLNFLSQDGKRSRSHGLPAKVLEMQAKAIGIPIIQVSTTWEDYEENFKKAVKSLKREGIEGGVFGDVDLEGHREWTQRVCDELKIKPVLPLWDSEPETLITEFLECGFKAMVVATNLDEKLLGSSLNKALLEEIRKFESHPCGENGEYHTFVTNGPIFKMPLKVSQGKRYKRDNTWFLEISLSSGNLNRRAYPLEVRQGLR